MPENIRFKPGKDQPKTRERDIKPWKLVRLIVAKSHPNAYLVQVRRDPKVWKQYLNPEKTFLKPNELHLKFMKISL